MKNFSTTRYYASLLIGLGVVAWILGNTEFWHGFGAGLFVSGIVMMVFVVNRRRDHQ